MEQTVRIAVLTRNSALAQRIRRGIELWAEEQCVRMELSRAEAADFRHVGAVYGCEGDEAIHLNTLSGVSKGAVYGREGDEAGEDGPLLIADFQDDADCPAHCAVAVCAGEREAIRAYRSHPAACIPPDFSYTLLCSAMDRCRDLWRSGLRRLPDLPLPMGRIQYAESRGKDTVLHTPDGTETMKLLLGRLADLLPSPPFLRCHSGFLISLPAMETVGGAEVVMTDGTRIPVSRRYAGSLRTAWEAWRRDRETFQRL